MYGIFTIIYLHDWVIYGVNVGIHIPAPWSIWEWLVVCIEYDRASPDPWFSRVVGDDHHFRRETASVQEGGPYIAWLVDN